jgi:NADH dehydrogenase
VIFGKEDQFLNLFAKLQSLTPVVPLAGASTRFQPVWVEDVAAAVVHCVTHPNTIGQTYEICGPDIFTLQELVQKTGQWAGLAEGKGRLVFGIPHALAWLQAFLMELAPGQPLMSRDNLASMQLPNVLDGRLPGLGAMGITPTPLETIGPQYLVADPANAGFDGLRKRHR